MLKKWLRKRRKSSSKQAEAAATKDAADDAGGRTKSSARLGKQSPGRIKKSKPKSPSRKSQYTSIEKEASRYSLSQTSLRSSAENSSSPTIQTYRNMPIDSSQFSAAKVEAKPETVKKEVPLVRIRPIERPKQRAAARSPAVVEQAVEALPPASLPAPPSASISTTPSSPRIKPAHRPGSPPTHFLDQTEISAPSSPPDHPFARDLSYLGVASPPSIDTALFAYEEAEKGDGKDMLGDESSPPTLIEAILPLKLAPVEVTTVHSDESEASVKSRSEILQDMATGRPFQDGDFFTATRSQSGSGSTTLQIWLDEVLRSIDDQKKKALPEVDKYHVGQAKEIAEEKSEKEESQSVATHDEQSLVQSKKMIDQVLKETIEKSRMSMATTPKGILKSKVVESGTINDVEVRNRWDCEDDSEDAMEEEEYDGEEEPLSDESSEEVVPIKVFSSSRRQKVADTEDETTSAESQSSSSAGAVYETLRQLNPTVSRDETQQSNSSMNFLSKICNVGEMMYEEGLCQDMDIDDGISISDDTFTSLSTVGSLTHRRGGWMCFDAF